MSEFDELVSAMPYPNRFDEACSTALQAILASPLWSVADPAARRIPWRQAERARRSMQREFGSLGLLVFGAAGRPAEPMLRYVGMTTRTLWQRLTDRYILGEHSQCDLAARYEGSLRKWGIEGFPPEEIQWYRSNFPGTTRLEHAVDFARHGINGIWLALIPALGNPATDKETLETLRRGVMRAGNRWNQDKGYPLLLNEL